MVSCCLFVSLVYIAPAYCNSDQEVVLKKIKDTYIESFYDGALSKTEEFNLLNAVSQLKKYVLNTNEKSEAQILSKKINSVLNSLSTYQDENALAQKYVRLNVGHLSRLIFDDRNSNYSAKSVHSLHPNIKLANDIAELLEMPTQYQEQLLEVINASHLNESDFSMMKSIVHRYQIGEDISSELLVQNMKPLQEYVYQYLDTKARRRLQNLLIPLMSKGMVSHEVAKSFFFLSLSEILELERNLTLALFYFEILTRMKGILNSTFQPTPTSYPFMQEDGLMINTFDVSNFTLHQILRGKVPPKNRHIAMQAEFQYFYEKTKTLYAWTSGFQFVQNLLIRLIPGVNVLLDGLTINAIVSDIASVVTIFTLGLGSLSKIGLLGSNVINIQRSMFVVQACFSAYFSGLAVLEASKYYQNHDQGRAAVYIAFAVFSGLGMSSAYMRSQNRPNVSTKKTIGKSKFYHNENSDTKPDMNFGVDHEINGFPTSNVYSFGSDMSYTQSKIIGKSQNCVACSFAYILSRYGRPTSCLPTNVVQHEEYLMMLRESGITVGASEQINSLLKSELIRKVMKWNKKGVSEFLVHIESEKIEVGHVLNGTIVLEESTNPVLYLIDNQQKGLYINASRSTEKDIFSFLKDKLGTEITEMYVEPILKVSQ